jgi:hypothetical protein
MELQIKSKKMAKLQVKMHHFYKRNPSQLGLFKKRTKSLFDAGF